MRNQHNDVGDELKAVAQDMLALGARAMQTGRDWLNDWRNDMNERTRREPRHAEPRTRSQADAPRQWQSQPYRQGQASHASDYYASQDYGRGQAYGQEGLHHDHRDAGYAWRGEDQRGMGYGTSSGYGNPQDYSYASGAYDRPSFASPADTQFHTGQYRGSGRYSGYGPLNYTRSDTRIREDVCERLTHDPDIDPRDVEVHVSEGTVTLEGTVGQRWMKHRAEDLADACGGVRNVENRIRVQPQSTMGSGAHSYGGTQAQQAHRASGGSETGSPSTPTSRSASASGGSTASTGSSSPRTDGPGSTPGSRGGSGTSH